MPLNLPTANTAPAPEWPPLNADQKKAVEAAAKIVTVLQDPRTEQAANRLGVGGGFFAKGTAGYSTAQFTGLVAITVSTALPRLLASSGADVSAWIQLGVGLYKAFSQAGKALSKLIANDAVYEQLYRDYPLLTFTCNNGQLDFQGPLHLCATARIKAEQYLLFIKTDELFLAKLYTWLYLRFGVRKDGELWGDPTFYYPIPSNGNCQAVSLVNQVPDGKSMEIADFLGIQGRYNMSANPLKIPFHIGNDVCNSEYIIQAVREFVYYYENNLLDDSYNLCVVIFNNAGFPNPDTMRDATRANNYFFESFRTAAKQLEDAKKKKEEQTTMYYYIAAIAIILLLIYYYYSKK